MLISGFLFPSPSHQQQSFFVLLISNIVEFLTKTSDHRERNIYNGALAPIGWRSYRPGREIFFLRSEKIDSTDPLAIDGATPLLPEGPPSWPLPDDEVAVALQQAFASGDWGRYHGGSCEELRTQLATYHQSQHVTLCCSGTLATELALRGLKVGAGDEVILAGYDFPGNFRAIEAIGARPVLVDIDADNWCLDPEALDEAISETTRAILVSHLHGGIAPMEQITALAKRYGIAVVEDACQAPGAKIGDRVAGTWGDVGVLSFGGSKLLTAGRGGAILSQHADVHQRIKVYSNRGNDSFPLSELQAAVLLPQLKKLDQRNKSRQNSVDRLLDLLDDSQGLKAIVNGQANRQPCYYKLAFRLTGPLLPTVSRERLIACLQAEGLALDAGFRGFVGRRNTRCRKIGELPHSNQAARNTLILHHPVLLESPETIDRVALAIGKVCRVLGSSSSA